jgi:hypothetical protein
MRESLMHPLAVFYLVMFSVCVLIWIVRAVPA